MYGSLEEVFDPGTSKYKYKWEKRGSWQYLLIAAGVPVGEQMAALSIIGFTVHYTKRLFMSCDARKIGVRAAFVCECTKTSLRYFPLLGIVISLIIAKRMLLRHRIYYEMLRHGYLLDFETVWPVTDHLFICLAGCIFLGSWHLVLIFIYSPTWSDFYPYAKDTFLAYFAPSAAFLAFLAKAYDTDNQLLPLNKYMIEDPEDARARLVIIPEQIASAIVHQGLHIPGGKECTSAECYAELVAIATDVETVAPDVAASVALGASKSVAGFGTSSIGLGSLEVARTRLELETVRLVRFVEEMWPAGVLLDRRIQDDAARSFRSVWYVGCALVIPLAAVVLYHLSNQAWKDVQDVREGQYEDTGAIIVEVVYGSITLWLLWKLYGLMARLWLGIESPRTKEK